MEKRSLIDSLDKEIPWPFCMWYGSVNGPPEFPGTQCKSLPIKRRISGSYRT